MSRRSDDVTQGIGQLDALLETRQSSESDGTTLSLTLDHGNVNVQPTNEHAVSSLLDQRPSSNVNVNRPQHAQNGASPRIEQVNDPSLQGRVKLRLGKRSLANEITRTIVGGFVGILGGVAGAFGGATLGAVIGTLGGPVGVGAGATFGAFGGAGIGLFTTYKTVTKLVDKLFGAGRALNHAEDGRQWLEHNGELSAADTQRLNSVREHEWRDLLSVSARDTGVRDKGDRKSIRRILMQVAAKQGLDAARGIKGDLTFLAARGRLPADYEQKLNAAMPRADDIKFAHIHGNAPREHMYLLAFHDQVMAHAHAHPEDPPSNKDFEAYKNAAVKLAKKIQSSEDLQNYLNTRQRFDEQIARFVRGLADPSCGPAELLVTANELNEKFQHMAEAERLGQFGGQELVSRYQSAFARVAARFHAAGDKFAVNALRRAIGRDSPVSALIQSVGEGGQFDSAREIETALKTKRQLTDATGYLSAIAGAGNSVSTDKNAVMDNRNVSTNVASAADQAIDSHVFNRYIEDVTLNDVLNENANEYLAGRYEHWAHKVGLVGEHVQFMKRASKLKSANSDGFDQAYAKLYDDLVKKDNASSSSLFVKNERVEINISDELRSEFKDAVENEVSMENKKKLLDRAMTEIKYLLSDANLTPFKEWISDKKNW